MRIDLLTNPLQFTSFFQQVGPQFRILYLHAGSSIPSLSKIADCISDGSSIDVFGRFMIFSNSPEDLYWLQVGAIWWRPQYGVPPFFQVIFDLAGKGLWFIIEQPSSKAKLQLLKVGYEGVGGGSAFRKLFGIKLHRKTVTKVLYGKPTLFKGTFLCYRLSIGGERYLNFVALIFDHEV
jgi:hypothetical protein